ncbi:hypothetical protein SAMN05421647_102542 [Marinobacterium stanieri]|uniref:Uncharacterized protein n=2 Tax=Marinobacterium stanieri TaxID=49186 RepID=A0A1N6QJ06_9GAMM|nr:hypothetical protein SAMN05421647_102542 [Marinobacterium stanieri]
MLVVKALVIWFLILMLAISNGVLRESVLLPTLGLPSGMIVSGLVLCALILIVSYLALPWLAVHKRKQQWALGLFWLFLTLGFEFSFAALQGQSLVEVLAAYTFTDGNLWPVVLVVTALAPRLMARLRERRE